MDEKIRASIKEENELVGFKCLHYSVTESSGFVEVTVIKKVLNQALVFGIRTVVGSAIKNKDYQHIDDTIHFDERTQEKQIRIPIIDN